MDRPPPELRRAQPQDLPAILDVATAALGWDPAHPNDAFFRWKHIENPAGPSPMWVALDADRVIGFRTMLRWRFTRDGGHEAVAVRAVDTATHPDHHRRGIFRSLTTTAVEQLTDEGVHFIFNTPNDKSRPGYLRMGWVDAGRVATRFSLGSARSVLRLARARCAADKWSIPIAAGDPIDSVADELVELLPATGHDSGLRTHATGDHLRWRYGFEPLHYRVIRSDHGAAVVRVRRRGVATEAVLADVFGPDAATTRALIKTIRGLTGVDHVLTLAHPPHPAPPLLPAPGLGPHLTLRALAEKAPTAADFRFSLGDIELF